MNYLEWLAMKDRIEEAAEKIANKFEKIRNGNAEYIFSYDETGVSAGLRFGSDGYITRSYEFPYELLEASDEEVDAYVATYRENEQKRYLAKVAAEKEELRKKRTELRDRLIAELGLPEDL